MLNLPNFGLCIFNDLSQNNGLMVTIKKAAFYDAKDGLLGHERTPFTTRKGASCKTVYRRSLGLRRYTGAPTDMAVAQFYVYRIVKTYGVLGLSYFYITENHVMYRFSRRSLQH